MLLQEIQHTDFILIAFTRLRTFERLVYATIITNVYNRPRSIFSFMHMSMATIVSNLPHIWQALLKITM